MNGWLAGLLAGWMVGRRAMRCLSVLGRRVSGGIIVSYEDEPLKEAIFV